MLSVHDELEKVMLGEDFPWYYHNGTVYMDDGSPVREDCNTTDTPFFTHIFCIDGRINSDYYRMILPIVTELEEVNGIKYSNRIFRAKANLVYKQPNYPMAHYQTPHKDLDGPHKVAIYYVNDSDGDTLLFNEDPNNMFGFSKFSINKRITPVKGKTIMFDGNTYHAGIPPRKNDVRVIINFVFTD